MKRMILKWLVCAALFLIGSIAWNAPGIAETPGVTDTVIKIGGTLPLSGPLAASGTRIESGVRLAFMDINDKGGIHGREVRLYFEDDQYRPAQQVAVVKKLLYRENVFCIGMAINCVALLPMVKKEKIPLFTASTAVSMAIPPKRYVFPFNAVGGIDGQLAVEYIAKDLKAKNPRIGIVYIEGEVGLDGLKSAEEGLKKWGLDAVAKVLHKPTSMDFTSQVINLKLAKAEYVILATVPFGATAFIQQCKKMNFSPKFVGIAIATDDTVIKILGDLTEGLIGVTPFAPPHDFATPGAKKYLELLKKYQPKESTTLFHGLGYAGGMVIEEGLRRAGKNLTREGFVEALETLKDYDTGLLAPVTYGPNDRIGSKYCYFVKADVKKKEFVLLDGLRLRKPVGANK